MPCVVTVLFEVEPDHWAGFLQAVEAQAAASLSAEPACHRFDVCVAADGRPAVFLYEVYADRAAFDAHLATPHFRAFDAKTAAWLRGKTVTFWTSTP